LLPKCTSFDYLLVYLSRSIALNAQFMTIVSTLRQDPFTPTQSFEKLTPPAAGKYSRRLNSQHRIVYSVDKINHEIKILSAWSHYE
ncbi:Txe/YoeB family addiction module toxin, partial [Lapidilactobacillus mulanensis]